MSNWTGKINVSHQAKIIKVLDQVQKRCRARTFTYEQAVSSLGWAQKHLDGLLSPSAQAGLEVVVTEPTGKLPASYGPSHPDATYITFQRGSRHWFITKVERGYADISATGRGWRVRGLERKSSPLLRSIYVAAGDVGATAQLDSIVRAWETAQIRINGEVNNASRI
jgi:hypothetical protein